MKPSAVPSFKIISEFEASAPQVFDAWLDPALIRRWMFAYYDIFEVKLDPRVGGRFSIVETSSDGDVDHFGEYRKIERPSLLIFTLSVPKEFSGSTLVKVEISPRDEGCVMIFTQTGVSKEITEGAWRDMFESLSRVLKQQTQ